MPDATDKSGSTVAEDTAYNNTEGIVEKNGKGETTGKAAQSGNAKGRMSNEVRQLNKVCFSGVPSAMCSEVFSRW